MNKSPRVRAKELFKWYLHETNEFTGSVVGETHAKEHAKRCAIRAIELVLTTIPDDPNPFSPSIGVKRYWQEIIELIKKQK